MVTTKGERYQLVKKDEAEDMKKTYVNLKPARKYRFHWWCIQSRESSYWPYCLHFNLFCILSWAAGFFYLFFLPTAMSWREYLFVCKWLIFQLFFSFLLPLYAFVQTVECSSISWFFLSFLQLVLKCGDILVGLCCELRTVEQPSVSTFAISTILMLHWHFKFSHFSYLYTLKLSTWYLYIHNHDNKQSHLSYL